MSGFDPGARTAQIVDGITGAEAKGMNSVLAFDPAVVRAQAEAWAGRDEQGPLHGVALGIKDNICTLEYPTTCASKILDGYRSPYEATAVSRLKSAGAIIACKTNLDEFAMGSSTEHSAYGRTQHPDDPGRVPGGSSGGSVALVASGAVEAALGSETGGSVRQPAAFCGVVGIKPSYGRVSRYGLVAFGSSLDQIGVAARSVKGAAAVLHVISGRDPNEATCADLPPMPLPEELNDLSGLTIGVPREYFPDDLDPGIKAACDRAIARMRDAGAGIKQVSLPSTSLAIPAYYVIAPAEASANLARYDGVRYGSRVSVDGDVQAMYRATRGTGFGAEVRRRILVGTYVLSAGYYEAYYGKAVRAREMIGRDFARAFEEVDLLFAPTTPTTAFRAGERLDDPVSMYLADAFVCPTNLAGIAAVSIPVGRSEGLPVGAQFIARAFDEPRMLSVAQVLEGLVDRNAEVRASSVR